MTDGHDGANKKIGSELLREDASLEGVVLTFVDGLKKRVSAMEIAARDGDFEALRNSAHQLKGSGGGYGYSILTDRAAVLEQEAKAHATVQCLTALEELKQVCDRIVVEPAE
ncbi:MAG: Hpt domain-containing protein [Planctomycetes bacterium]|nr:Hpt domain-containing protein [Planctomycetota bacterium]